MLRQYLEEIGYSEKVLDVRSFRVKNLLGLMSENDTSLTERFDILLLNLKILLLVFSGNTKIKAAQALNESERAVLDAADAIRGKKNPQNRINGGGNSDIDYENLDLEAVTALDEFSFLEKSPLNETVISVNQSNRQTNNEEWNVDPKQIQKMTEIYRFDINLYIFLNIFIGFRSEKERKRTNSTSSTETPDTNLGNYFT